MSGGVAYVWDPEEDFLQNCNLEMVELEKVEAEEDVAEVNASLFALREARHNYQVCG
jgi:glutamate synthase (NADPH/NADH) large chain